MRCKLRVMEACVCTMMLVCALAARSVCASAVVVPLSDHNSTAAFRLTPPGTGETAGMYNWTVDGISHLQQQWFWYRVGPSGPEQSVDSLTLQSYTLTDTNIVDVTYADTGVQFSIDLRFSLTGGDTGTGTSDMSEQLSIHNLTASALDFHFFQYTNFDLAGSSAGDTVEIQTTSRSADASQSKGGSITADTVAIGKPSHYEAGEAASILGELTNAAPDTLGDIAGPVSPSDATWAFEWDPTIKVGGTYLISEDKLINSSVIGTPTVPLPSAAWMGAACLAGLALAATRQRLAPRHLG